jgi:hypothetical protein
MLVVVVSTLPGLALAAAPWSVSVDDKSGLPVIAKGGAAAVTTNFAFWGNNWAWAGVDTQFQVDAPFKYTVVGKIAKLDINLTAHYRKASAKQMRTDIDLEAAKTLDNVIGGGLAFKFNLDAFGAEMGEPQLLPNNSGWTWGRSDGDRIEMRFDPPVTQVYFEPGGKKEIRTFFYRDKIAAGHTRTTATLSAQGRIDFVPTTAEKFGNADQSDWPTDIVDWKTSPVDVSFLNKPEIPAGKHGFLQARGDKLVFEDGTPVRFWGTNLTAYALFGTSKEGTKQQARRLSELGFNLVRLHHHDSPWVVPNVFGDKSPPNTRTLSEAQMDRLDWWIKCLKDEGIYVWLDLHVQRMMTPGDNIEHFDEIAKGKPTADPKGFNYVNASIRQAMKDFAKAYLGHMNTYTGHRYADEPAIAAILVTNENDITSHYGNGLLPDKKVPAHSAIYMADAKQFAATWGLPPDRVWHAWEPGPGKIFLNDLEYRFDEDMIQYLRSLGVRVPIVPTSTWGGNPMSSLLALTTGGMIDVHTYGRVGELEKNPLYAANFMDWIAFAQVAGKPLSVTEWNVESFPVPDRHVTPLFVAGWASLQGWDAMMLYAYSQAPLDNASGPSNWHAFNDPALIGTLPAAALLYRQGQVQESPVVYAFTPTPDQLFNQALTPGNAAGLRTAAELGKLVIVMPKVKELPWLGQGTPPPGAKIITDPAKPLIPDTAEEAVADGGEVRRNWATGIYTVATPRTQAVAGWIGGRTVKLDDVTLAMGTPNAAVAVQSLDGKPIRQSHDIVVSMAARSIPKSAREMPFRSEPVEGRISVRAPAGLKLYARDGASGELKPLPVNYADGRYAIQADKSLKTWWLFLR